MDEGNHQKIGTRKLQLERRFDFAKARGTNERSLVSGKKKTDPRLRTLPKEMAKGMAASPEWSTAMTPPPRPPGSEDRSARYGSPAMAREQPLAPPSSRARRPPKKVGERRRRVAMIVREGERWAEAQTERGKGNGGQALSARGLMEEGFCPAPREGRAGGKSFFVIARREKKEAAGAAAALACSFAAGFRHFVGDASLAGGPRTRKALELAGAPRVSFRSGQDSENLQKTGLCGLGVDLAH